LIRRLGRAVAHTAGEPDRTAFVIRVLAFARNHLVLESASTDARSGFRKNTAISFSENQ
jgi:hypothetical protein